MNPNEIVVREVQPKRRHKILYAVAESIRKPREPSQEGPAVQEWLPALDSPQILTPHPETDSGGHY